MRAFFQFVIPSVLSFALSGVYAIVDGFFIGNSIGDIGISAINMAYPIVAVIQSLGTGIGMGGAIYYSINRAEKKESQAREFTAGALWVLMIASVLLTISIFFLNDIWTYVNTLDKKSRKIMLLFLVPHPPFAVVSNNQ